MGRIFAWMVFALALLMPAGLWAEQTEAETQAKERVYGWELMSPDEFAEQRAKMRAAKTEEERERIRAEHHAAMAVRAQERGVVLIGPRAGGAGRGQKRGGGSGAGGRGGGPQR